MALALPKEPKMPVIQRGTRVANPSGMTRTTSSKLLWVLCSFGTACGAGAIDTTSAGPTGSTPSPADATLSSMISLARPYADQKDELVARFTTLYLAQLLEASQGNQTEAARMAGLDRGYLGKLLARHSKKG